MDTIVGCFAIGLDPSGSTDPFALRRHALAIIRILEKEKWDLSLVEFISEAVLLLQKTLSLDAQETISKVVAFFKERYRQMMMRQNYSGDLVDAVLSAGFKKICDLRLKIEQLKEFSTDLNEFDSLVKTFKRMSNILKDQKSSGEVERALFEDACEDRVWETYEALRDELKHCFQVKNYYQAMKLMAQFSEPVDAFFEGVEILTQDKSVRENRVAMLRAVAGVFGELADFSRFSVAGS